MFNDIASVYDLGNHLLSFGLDFLWRKRLANELRQFAPDSVLDLACGTADLAIAISQTNPQSFITAIDLAQNMLKVAAPKIARLDNSGSFALAQADIERMPFPDASFAAASIAFGIRNVERREAGLAEIHRLLKPGGVFAVLEFSMPHAQIFAALYRIYLGVLLPLIGKLLSGDESYFYLRDTIREFPAPEEFTRELQSAGFSVRPPIALSFGAVWLYLARVTDP